MSNIYKIEETVKNKADKSMRIPNQSFSLRVVKDILKIILNSLF